MKAIHVFSLLAILLLFSCVGNAPSDDSSEEIDLQTELDVDPVTFEIPSDVDTMLFGDQGTAIFIGKNTFVMENGGAVEGDVEVSLKEYYNMSDILTQNLSTTSKGKRLETGGMINVSATSDGEPLRIKRGKDIIVHFPKNGNDKEMNLFSESKSDVSMGDERITWSEEPPSKGREVDTMAYFYTKLEGLDFNHGEDEADGRHSLYLEDGRHICTWAEDEIELTQEERDYVRFRDVNIKYTVTKSGDLKNIRYEKDYDKSKVKRLMKIVKSMPKLQPYTISGEPVDNDGWMNFAVKYIPPKYAGNGDYLDQLEKGYSNFEDMSINDLDQMELNYYIFNSTKLGWLNCDRFTDDDGLLVDMTLKLDNSKDAMVKLIYRDLKSVVISRYQNGKHHFNNLPEGSDVTLMIMRNKGDQVELSLTEHITRAGELSGLDFKNYTMGELKKELAKLN